MPIPKLLATAFALVAASTLSAANTGFLYSKSATPAVVGTWGSSGTQNVTASDGSIVVVHNFTNGTSGATWPRAGVAEVPGRPGWYVTVAGNGYQFYEIWNMFVDYYPQLVSNLGTTSYPIPMGIPGVWTQLYQPSTWTTATGYSVTTYIHCNTDLDNYPYQYVVCVSLGGGQYKRLASPNYYGYLMQYISDNYPNL